MLRHRNQLLRRRPAPSGEELEPWDRQLAEAAETLVPRRAEVVLALAEAAGSCFRRLSEGRTELGLEYRAAAPATADEVLAGLARRRREELARGTTLVGPHRDDLELRLDGRSLRRFGSQGQQRSAALALRLAEARVLTERSGEGALVLLDACVSALDPGRRGRLLEVLAEWRQVFVTATSVPPGALGPVSVLEVRAGSIRSS